MNFNDCGVILPDVSFYQDDDTTPGKVDFEQMRAHGASGVILRGGQNAWLDEDFKDYKTAAKAAGLPRGYYWFYDSRADPVKQAQLWANVIFNDLPELGLWVDLEESYNGPYQGEKYWKIFVESMLRYFPGTLLGIYTANWWWSAQAVGGPSYWGMFPLWVAQYTTVPADVVIPSPWQRSGCILWQYTDKGNGLAYGAESLNIDLNKFNGTLEQFNSYFRLNGQPPPEDTMALYEGTAKLTSTPNVRIRKPDADGSLDPDGMTIGAIQPGQAFKADKLAKDPMSRDWLHITEVGGKPIDGWSAAWLCDYHEVNVTPMPTPIYADVSYTVTLGDNVNYQAVTLTGILKALK